MRVAAVRQWQWVLLSLIVGAAIGYTRQWVAADFESQFGQAINSQARFEDALLRTEQGRPWFTNVAIHRCSIPDGKGGSRQAYVVVGDYFNGNFEHDGGKLTAVWRPAFFVADMLYSPATDLQRLGPPELARRFHAIGSPTVADFLDLVSLSRGTRYKHAWWRELGFVSWLLLSFVCIGIVWPTVINLIVYGTLLRPPEEKGIDLSKVKIPAKPTAAAPSEADLARLMEIEAELEAQAGGAVTVPASAATTTQPAIRKLASEPLDAIAAASSSSTEFGAKKEDYYPTARSAPTKPPRPGSAAAKS